MTTQLLHRLEVRNYKCLRQVTVEFAPMTVLIGRNDTGKSSLLELVGLLPYLALAGGANYVAQMMESNRTRGREPKDVSLKVESPHGPVTILLDPNQLQQLHRKPRTEFVLAGPYRLDPMELRKPAQVYSLQGKPLPSTGQNLVDVIDRLPYKRFGELQEEFTARLPMVAEILATPVATGQKQLFFTLKDGARVSAQEMSDGSLLYLAFLAIAFDELSPKLIMIEEPENGVHPRQLEHIARLLTRLTTDRGVQIIVTTHSPYLLDFVPKESVRVFTRDPQKGTSVDPMADSKFVRDLLEKGYTLGEVWYNAEEEQIVGEKA
jgi:predicted ATPase